MAAARPLLVGLLVLLVGCGRGAGPGPREATRQNVIAAAREVMDAARFAALVTVDGSGQARARTVAPLPPLPGDPPLSVWIATRPVTRKVAEIQAEPRVVLYYFDAARKEYVTLAGRARLVDESAEKQRRGAHLSRELYPDWPEDCLLIEVQPERVEVQGRGLEPDPETWLPAGVSFPASAPASMPAGAAPAPAGG